MKINSWHAKTYLLLNRKLPNNVCGYFWGWIKIVWVSLFLLFLLTVFIFVTGYFLVSYFNGWVILFSGGDISFPSNGESFNQDSRAFWWVGNVIIVIATVIWLLIKGVFLFGGMKVSSKFCKPIKWE